MDLRDLYLELRRRHVIRVTGLYLVAAWVMVEAAATIFPVLGWSERAAQLVLFAALLGLPVVFTIAWLYEARSIRAPVRTAGLLGLGMVITLIGFAAISRYPSSAASRIESIAVLPFVDLSPSHDQGYFTDGVTEELMNRLSHAGLTVAARTSSFAFKGQNLEVSEIARRLNVQAILEGSIRREGDSLRISVKLIDARTQSVIWGDSFDRNASSIFAIQDEISQSIVEALKLKLTPEATRLARRAGTRSVEAQELYFKGLKEWHDGTDAQLRAALTYFEQAVAADSTYALAYAGIAKTYAVLPAFGDFPAFDALTLGKQAAARAAALDAGLGDAHAALGQIAQNLEWDIATALKHYRNALRASPNDATAHQWYAEGLLLSGDLVAASNEIARALELDPLSAPAKNLRAYQLLLRRDHAAAIRMYQILVREHPSFRFGQLNLALAALAVAEYGDAAQALVAALPQFGPDVGVYISATSNASERAAAVRLVERIEQTQRASVAALLYAAIGDREHALEHLEQAYRTASDANLPYWLLHPLLDPLRSNKRFQEVARGVGVARVQ